MIRHGPRPPPRVAHRCPSCGRLLGLQTGTSLHVKRKDFEAHLEGRSRLRCRCGALTVVITVPCDPS